MPRGKWQRVTRAFRTLRTGDRAWARETLANFWESQRRAVFGWTIYTALRSARAKRRDLPLAVRDTARGRARSFMCANKTFARALSLSLSIFGS